MSMSSCSENWIAPSSSPAPFSATASSADVSRHVCAHSCRSSFSPSDVWPGSHSSCIRGSMILTLAFSIRRARRW
jgi:hypothetical protein